MGLGQNFNTSFERSIYVNASTGVQFNIDGYVKPEFELRFFYGNLEDNTIYDVANDFKLLKNVLTSFQAINWSVTPNFSFPLGESKSWYLSLKPKYNYAEIKATDVIFVYQDSKIIHSEVVREGISRSFGINIGILGKVWSESFDSVLMSVFMDNINFNKVIKSPNNRDVDTKYNLGFGVTYYFSFKKKK